MKAIKIFSGIVMYVTLLSGCSKSETEPDNMTVTDPVEAILGKWELVAIEHHGERNEAYKPAGYIEYLPDSQMGWHDYATRTYEVLQGKYRMDFEVYEDTVWYLHYEPIRLDDEYGTVYEYYPDKAPGSNNFICTFITKNQMGLVNSDIWSLRPMPLYIYKRKK
jgi:hypothetical protein